MIESPYYLTSDTAMASWLISQGHILYNIDTTDPQSVVFLFENDDESLQTNIKLFQSGEASGSILAFFRAYKRLLFQIKEKTSGHRKQR